ncbi:YggS family pyridoxal phosphate enzyme [Gammaproteobacteria bacterium 42_54_T18]|nr:YggS family pyridoxal phosphate enzyme [Gammaproteobacteria bacterium 42_54_T18]
MPISEQQIADRQQGVEKRISLACQKHQRSIPTLLAVSKTRTAENIRTLYSSSIKNFGENYLQEALDKQQQLTDCNICWHFIGPIQSNKSRAVAEHFHWVHSVDRLKLAKRLSNQRPSTLPPLQICLQVNIDNETSKSGFMIDEAVNAAIEISQLPNLRLRGLMCIPQKRETFAEQRQPFEKVARLLSSINQQLPRHTLALDTLSMGMSDDIEAAIAEGTTIIRIGTALFGPRQ